MYSNGGEKVKLFNFVNIPVYITSCCCQMIVEEIRGMDILLLGNKIMADGKDAKDWSNFHKRRVCVSIICGEKNLICKLLHNW